MREAIYNALSADPERIVIVGDEATVTAKNMLKTAEWLRCFAVTENLPKDHVYVISCKSRRDAIVFKTACYLNDFSFAALDDGGAPPNKIKSACQIVEAGFLISDIPDDPDFPNRIVKIYPTANDVLDAGIFELPKVDPNPRSKYVVFTSGTTGEPKAIPIEFNKLEQLIRVFLADYAVMPDDKWAQFSSSGFDLSLLDLFAPLAAGAQLVTLDGWLDRLHPYNAIARHGVTIWHSTPTALRKAPRESTFKAPDLRLLIFCGEPLGQRNINIATEHFPNARVFNHYGPAETTIYCARFDVTDWCQKDGPIPIGHAIPGWQIHLASPSRKTPSEIVIESKFISEGYLNADNEAFSITDNVPAKTMQFKTGDVGYHEHGLLFFSSRKDDQIKIDGHRIELSEIDAVFSELTSTPCKSVFINNGLHLFVEAYEGDEIALRQSARAWLANAKLPEIHFIPEFPRNANHKVDQRKLRNLVTNQQACEKIA